MNTATMAPPWPVSGYGIAPEDIHVAPFVETTAIWYTPGTYDDPENAVEGAAEHAEAFLEAGHTITGVGMEIVSIDLETDTAVYRGYITFAGEAPTGSLAMGGKLVGPPWWHYGLAAAGGVLGGIIIGALIGHYAK